MAGMPAMDRDDKKPSLDVALIMGGGKPKSGGKPSKEPDGDEPGEPGGDELPAGFEAAFSEAFPDAAGDTEKMMALKRLIESCMGDY